MAVISPWLYFPETSQTLVKISEFTIQLVSCCMNRIKRCVPSEFSDQLNHLPSLTTFVFSNIHCTSKTHCQCSSWVVPRCCVTLSLCFILTNCILLIWLKVGQQPLVLAAGAIWASLRQNLSLGFPTKRDTKQSP